MWLGLRLSSKPRSKSRSARSRSPRRKARSYRKPNRPGLIKSIIFGIISLPSRMRRGTALMLLCISILTTALPWGMGSIIQWVNSSFGLSISAAKIEALFNIPILQDIVSDTSAAMRQAHGAVFGQVEDLYESFMASNGSDNHTWEPQSNKAKMVDTVKNPFFEE